MGPTASGKSAMALQAAQIVGCELVNADAMQCYRDVRIITARPTDDEMRQAPHHLYGCWPADKQGNVASWLAEAEGVIRSLLDAGTPAMLVGGTGMYIRALMEGLSRAPPISVSVRQAVEQLSLRSSSNEGGDVTALQCNRLAGMTSLYAALQAVDPRMASQLQPGDRQRIVRALEVMLETGRSLLDWQAEQPPAPFPRAHFRCAYINIPRDIIYARINQRFAQMVHHGALEEIAALMQQIAPDGEAFNSKSSQEEYDFMQRYPILKAHGVPELIAHLQGNLPLEDAIAQAQRNTRRYAKRQMTWIRGQLPQATALPYRDYHKALGDWLKR